MLPAHLTIDALWESALRDILEYGRDTKSRKTGRDTQTKEVIGWSARLVRPDFNFLCNPRRKLCPVYASCELLWYLSGKDTIEAVIPYAPSYDKFVEPDTGKAYGAYGYRLQHALDRGPGMEMSVRHVISRHLVDVAMDALERNDESRQVILSMWRPDDLTHAVSLDKRDLPCTICWQFMVRDNSLCMQVYMRSNDAWLGLPYDVYVFTTIQKIIADTLGVEVGDYVHNVGSMHLYKKDVDKAREALTMRSDSMPHKWGKDIWDDRLIAVVLESEMRDKSINTSSSLRDKINQHSLEGPLRDAVACLSHRWFNVPCYPESECLRRAIINYKVPV